MPSSCQIVMGPSCVHHVVGRLQFCVTRAAHWDCSFVSFCVAFGSKKLHCVWWFCELQYGPCSSSNYNLAIGKRRLAAGGGETTLPLAQAVDRYDAANNNNNNNNNNNKYDDGEQNIPAGRESGRRRTAVLEPLEESGAGDDDDEGDDDGEGEEENMLIIGRKDNASGGGEDFEREATERKPGANPSSSVS